MIRNDPSRQALDPFAGPRSPQGLHRSPQTPRLQLGSVENGFLLDSLAGLRHSVFCSELGWVPLSPDSREEDCLDPISHHIAAWFGSEVVGYLRLVRAPDTFLTEICFQDHLGPGVELRKTRNCAEITRMCIRRDFRLRRFPSDIGPVPLSLWLYRETYRWCRSLGIRYNVFVTTRGMARLLGIQGFPLRRLSELERPADQVLSELDWTAFDGRMEGTAMLDWFRNCPVFPLAERPRSPAPGS
jgi:acyl homoserine lactone synthase